MLLLVPLGSAIALAGVATALIDQRFARLRQIHQQTEDALRQSEANLRQTQQIARLGSWELDLVTQNVTWSDELFRIFGLDSAQSQLPYDQIMAAIPEGDREKLSAAINQAIADGSPYEVEHRIGRPDGTTRYLLSRGQAKTDDAQHITKLFGTALDITDRKRAELALQASETRFQEIAQTLNQVPYVISLPSGEYLYISPAYERLWGYSCESLYQDSKSWLNRIYPDDLDYVSEAFNQLLTGQKKRLEYRIFAANGEVRWIESESLIVKDENGNPLRVVGLADDITHRKQVETTLRDQEAKLRAIGDNLPRGFIYQLVHNPDRGFYYSYISAGIERITGLTPEAMLQNPNLLQDSLIEEDRLMREQLTQQSIETLSLFEMQMRARNVAGELRWLSVVSVPRRLEDGSTVWDGVVVDITSLKQAEVALRNNEELFRSAFDDAPIGIALISPAGEFLKVNRYLCNLLGYSQKELLELCFRDITHSGDLDQTWQGLAQMLGGELSNLEIKKRYISKQGTVIPVLINISLVHDIDGTPLYCIEHVQDIREQLKVERMKDEFVSIVSHELRTPITSINGSLVLLNSGIYDARPEKARNMLQVAIRNSDRLVRLVDDILSFERLESGKVQLEKEDCAVAHLLYQAIDAVQPLADQSGITLALTPLTATLWAAPDGIIQVLTNLLSNAVKFSSPGGTVWVNASTERLDDSASNLSVLFTVQDHGRGIPADKLETIFDQFQQVDASDSRHKGGTGLGLSICKNIVEQHGGSIWVESCLGQGSTFFFTVPLGRSEG
ncbi:PAS domain S-box protein [Nodosilinea nodulosa]|uniref:PAS domain S-box protein n=1 Tax=Nodosilinea nodulosa TaxID=416001 RepID=UPI0003165BB5|nr:PAS domain S-box protein [Nodosilinea nodulosa]